MITGEGSSGVALALEMNLGHTFGPPITVVVKGDAAEGTNS